MGAVYEIVPGCRVVMDKAAAQPTTSSYVDDAMADDRIANAGPEERSEAKATGTLGNAAFLMTIAAELGLCFLVGLFIDLRSDGDYAGKAEAGSAKLYDGHAKTFWFASVERYRQASAQPPVTVPSQQLVNGDFSGLVVPDTTTQIPIFVPIAWQADPSLIPSGCNPGAAPGQQFPGNIIPQNCFSRVSKSLLGFVPKPTSPGEIGNFQPSWCRKR